jgi:hypothetical protein
MVFRPIVADVLPQVAIIAASIGAILFAFVVVPEILERRGHNPRSAFVRAFVWASFLAIVFVPAVATGHVFSITNPADWLYGLGFLAVAILWDYYRLNPDKVPRLRSRT